MERGWLWSVYPRGYRQGDAPAMVAVGIHGDPDVARKSVEQVLGNEDAALYGEVIHPRGQIEICRRGREPGEYIWRMRTVDYNGGEDGGS